MAEEGGLRTEGMTSVERMLAGQAPKGVISDTEVMAFIEAETPMDRIRAMYSRNTLGEYSPDLLQIGTLTKNTAGLVFLGTAVLGGYAARETYVQKNKHVTYATKFQAMRSYNDAIFFGSLRFGIKWAFKSGIFTGLFMLVSQSISVYRNKTSVIDYIAAGGVTCAVLRFDVGLRGMLAGGVIGSVLGLAAGLGLTGMLYAANETQQKRHHWQIHELLRERKEVELLASAQMTSPDSPRDPTNPATSFTSPAVAPGPILSRN
jgi:hypothetical protein